MKNKYTKKYGMLSAFILSIISISSLPAATVTFQAVQDTTLISGNPTTNYGTLNSIWVGNNAGERKVLLQFDLGSLADPNIQIQSVTLTMTQINLTDSNNGVEIGVNLYQVQNANAAWGEGYSSWNWQVSSTVPATPWAGSNGLSTAGTDYVAAPIDGTKIVTARTGSQWSGTTYDWTLPISLIEDWIDGNNAGLLFAAANFGSLNANDYFRFASSEHATVEWRPTLTIDYTIIPEPNTIGLALLGMFGFLARRRRV